MEKEVIIQLPAYQTYSDTGVPLNNGVNKVNNAEWEVTLAQPVIINTGDRINIRQAYLDTRQTNSNAVVIENDTQIQLEYYFYMMLPPDMWNDNVADDVTGQWNYEIYAGDYANFFVDDGGINIINPDFRYGATLNEIGKNQNLPFEIPLVLRHINGQNGGRPITKSWTYTLKAGTYAYDDLALILTRAMSQIPNPLNVYNEMNYASGNAFLIGGVGKNWNPSNPNTNPQGNTYNTNYNGNSGCFSEFLKDVSVPIEYTNSANTGDVSFNNPFTMVAGAKSLIPSAGNFSKRTLFANQVVGSTEISLVYNDAGSRFEFQYTHTPLQSQIDIVEPQQGVTPVASTGGAPVESVLICGAINNADSAEPPASEQSAQSPNLTIGQLYKITNLGNNEYFVFSQDNNQVGPLQDWSSVGGPGFPNAAVGSTFVATTNGLQQKMQFTMSQGTAQMDFDGFSDCNVIPVSGSVTNIQRNICRYSKHSGIMFKRMQPFTFWNDLLGFDVNEIVTTDDELNNRTMTMEKFKRITTDGYMGQTNNFDFNIKPTIPVPSYTPNFYSYLPLATQNSAQTASGVAADISIEQVLEIAQDYCFYTQQPNAQVYFPFTFSSVATIPLEASKAPLGAVDQTGHSLIELTLGYNNLFINNKGNYNVKAILSNYYQSPGSFSSMPFGDAYVYQHLGESMQLSTIKIRILDPITMNNLQGLGGNSCIYLQVDKTISQLEADQIDA